MTKPTDAPETLTELAWAEKHVDLSTESSEARYLRLGRAREIARNIRAVVAFLHTLGWPGRWPRELLITHRGRE